jgi:hypothetical protein
MRSGLDPFSILVVSIAGWMNQRQQQVIEYLVEENRVLKEQIGNRRMPECVSEGSGTALHCPPATE